MPSLTWTLLLVGIIQCSADSLQIHVDSNGADTAKCLQGESSCLTVNYTLSKLQDKPRDQPPVEIIVSSSEQKFPCIGVYGFKLTSLSIVGDGNVTFIGNFALAFEPNLTKNVLVIVKGIRFENCRQSIPYSETESDAFNPAVMFVYLDTLVFEDCTVRYGNTVFVRVQNVTIDGCVFSDFSSSEQPVITSWVKFPDSLFGKSSQLKRSWTKDNSNIGSLVVQNSLIKDNTGIYTGPSDDYPGPGYVLVDVSGLPLDAYFGIIHYDILISNCSFTNNKFIGQITPFIYSDYGQNFSANFTLENCNFVNNSITQKEGETDVDAFPLFSISMNTNTVFVFTMNQCSFLDDYYPSSGLLGYQDSVNIELNVFDSTFRSSNLPQGQGLHVTQDWSGNSANYITTSFRHNKYV